MRKSIILLASLLAAAACGNQGANSNASPEMGTPNVEVTTAVARDVPIENVYASDIQPYATNNIAPQSAGRIRKINVEVGDYVVKGQILAEMDRLQLDQTELQVQNDDLEYERIKALYQEGGVSQSDFETAELGYKVRKTTLENLRENTILRSPLTGVVSARNFDAGDLYSMGSPLFTVLQIRPVKVLVGISESEYTKIHKGDEVSLTVDAIPGRVFTGKVERLYPTVDAATHTFKARVIVPNQDNALLPGMYARVTVNFGTRHSVIVPDRALVKQEGTGTRFIYVLKADNTVSYIPVTVGRHMDTEMEILSGLEEGAQVVVKGQALLKDGVKVNVL